MPVEPADLVLGAIVPARADLMATARVRLDAERHFFDYRRTIFALLCKFYDSYGTLLDADLFARIVAVSDADAARQVALVQAYRSLCELRVTDSKFAWAADELIDSYSRRRTGEAIAEAYEIQERGWEDPDGKPGVVLRGHEAARAHLFAKLTEVERLGQTETAPEGDMRLEARLALEDYARRRALATQGAPPGIRSGIKPIDLSTGGIQDGELGLVVAYVGQGKSMLVTQWAWNACVVEGHDVAIFTTETIRDQVKRRIYARHSRLPQFEMPGGINSKDLRRGTLDAAGEKVFEAVVDDLERNPSYGRLHLAQVPNLAPISYVETRLRELGRRCDLRLCVIDYLTLLRSDNKREKRQEELNDVLMQAKMMATSFADGRGIPVLSPWSVSQPAWKQAMTARVYTLASLSDTSEAEKSSDWILAILREPDDYRAARFQFLKIRDGDLPPIQEVSIDFRTSYLGEREGMTVLETAPNGAVRSELDEFLGMS